jgi:hypothetical protein
LFVVYSDDTGKLCRLQKGAEFSHYADWEGITPSQMCACSILAKKTHLRREGSSFIISVIAEATIQVYTNNERTYITACEEVISNLQPVSFYSSVPFFGEGIVEDEFDADSVVDILIPSAQVSVISCTCHGGEVAVEGELMLSVLAMRGENPVCIERTIPFHSAVPYEDSGNPTQAFCTATLRDLSVNATVQEDRGKCSVAVSATLALAGVTQTVREVPALLDAFEAGFNLTMEQGEEQTTLFGELHTYSERVSGTCAVKSKLDYTCVMKAIALPQVEYTYHAETERLEGAITAQLFYERNGQDLSTEVTLPFSVAVQGAGSVEGWQVLVGGVSVRQTSEEQCTAEATLKIITQETSVQTTNYVSRLEEGNTVAENASAISIVLPNKGDSLWDIAKRMKRSPEQVLAENADLHFPLNGTERIVIYRQTEKI